MAEQVELETIRSESRSRVLELKENIPTSQIFNWAGRSSKFHSPGYWMSSIVSLNLLLLLPALLVWLELGNTEMAFKVSAYGVVATEFVVLGYTVTHVTVQRTYNDLANRVIKRIEHLDDFSELLLWLKVSWSKGNITLFMIPFCLIWVILGAVSVSGAVGQFVGFGFSAWCLINGLFAGLMIYALLWECRLAYVLREFRYEMNYLFPADSEIIIEISDMQTKSIYALAVTTAVISFMITSSLIDQTIRTMFSLPLLAIGWITIAFQFLLTRSTLSAITNRAKWSILDRIRIKINMLEASGDLSDRETSERLFRLGDVHKQIMTSKTSTFDFKSVSTLLSQLMIPFLGLLLGNLDEVKEILGRLIK
jgi:hypothetical protein